MEDPVAGAGQAAPQETPLQKVRASLKGIGIGEGIFAKATEKDILQVGDYLVLNRNAMGYLKGDITDPLTEKRMLLIGGKQFELLSRAKIEVRDGLVELHYISPRAYEPAASNLNTSLKSAGVLTKFYWAAAPEGAPKLAGRAPDLEGKVDKAIAGAAFPEMRSDDDLAKAIGGYVDQVISRYGPFSDIGREMIYGRVLAAVAEGTAAAEKFAPKKG